MDADERYILDQLMDGFRPTPRRRGTGGERHNSRPQPVSSREAANLLLDDYEMVFYRDGSALDYVGSVADTWRATGLKPEEIRE